MEELYYVYPIYKDVSFSLISKNHIKHLNSKVKIQEIDESVLDSIMWVGEKRILLHPIGYLLLGDRIEHFKHRIKRLYKLQNVANVLGGFDTADSDKISRVFVNVLNQMDLVMVPSSWAKETYERSGVESPIEIIPHGLNEAFLTESKEIKSDGIQKLIEIKEKHNAILVLFFLTHSGFRKGADLVAEAMKRIQREYDNVFLVVKTSNIVDPYLRHLSSLKMIHIKGFLNDNELRELYDACDILLCPSRGGGFELNALEGIARGLITLVPNGMCFTDYVKYAVPVELGKSVQVFDDNPIHIGNGYEVDVDDLTKKLMDTIDKIDRYKRKFKRNSKIVRREYSWKKICEKLLMVLEEYGFVGT